MSPISRKQLRPALVNVVVLLGLAGLLMALEVSPPWSGLDSTLRGLDFDTERAWLFEAWLATMLLALTGTLATGSALWSAAASAGFFILTYALPLVGRLAGGAPSLFGIPEQVEFGSLARNLAAVVAVGCLVTIPAVATGDLIRRGLLRWLRQGRSARRTATAAAVVIAFGGALLFAPAADPVLRYGPQFSVYRPGPLPARTLRAWIEPATQPLLAVESVPSTGRYLTSSYFSQAMGEQRQFDVYLPPTYGLKHFAARHYPVMFLLHGDQTYQGAWRDLGAPALLDAGIAQGAIPETIVVMPDGNGRLSTATQWANRVDGRDRIEDSWSCWLSLTATTAP